jgi:hypothetical protein
VPCSLTTLPPFVATNQFNSQRPSIPSYPAQPSFLYAVCKCSRFRAFNTHFTPHSVIADLNSLLIQCILPYHFFVFSYWFLITFLISESCVLLPLQRVSIIPTRPVATPQMSSGDCTWKGTLWLSLLANIVSTVIQSNSPES